MEVSKDFFGTVDAVPLPCWYYVIYIAEANKSLHDTAVDVRSSGNFCYLRDKHQKEDKRAKCTTLIVLSNIYLNILHLQFTLFNSLQELV